MKLTKLLMLFFFGALFFASNLKAQNADPSLSVQTANSGVVTVGGINDLTVTLINSLGGNIPPGRMRPIISIPPSVTFLPDALQTGLPAGFTIVSNSGSQLRFCNSSTNLAGFGIFTIVLKIQGVSIAPATTIQGQFNPATNCLNGPNIPGDVQGNNAPTTTIQVIAAPACAITSSATATPILCNGGTTTLTATSTGGVGTIEYSLNGGTFQAGNTFTVPAGSYTVTAREVASTSCSATSTSVVIADPALLVASATSTPVSVAGGTNGTATATATGGTGAYTYLWAPGGQTTPTATNLAEGSYTVTITDANGCAKTATTVVGGPAPCTIDIASVTTGTIACVGGTTTLTVVLTVPQSGVEYNINGGAFQSSNVFTVPAGTYTAIARLVSNPSCSSTDGASVGNPTVAFVASATAPAIACFGGTSTLTTTATGGTISGVNISGPGGFTANNSSGVFTGLFAGTYTVIAQSTAGCTSTTTVVIGQPTAALVASATFAPITTFGGTTTVNVTATGGTAPYTGTGAFVRGDGTFTFTVTDANSCTKTTTVTIAPFSTPVTADPAVGGMNFTTTTNALQSANTLLFAPAYRLRVPFYNRSQTDVVPNGTIRVTVNLGKRLVLDPAYNLATAPLSNFFTWTSAVVSGNVVITGTQIAQIPEDFDGVLVFGVKGSLSCTSTIASNITIVNLSAILIDEDLANNNALLQYTLPVTVSTTQVNVTCNGAANGIINVTSSPGTTVVIRNAANAIVTNTNLAPGVYSVTASATGDAPLSNTCSNVVNVTIVQPLVLSVTNTATTNNICNAGTNGTATFVSTGGTAPFAYTIAGPTVNTTGATTGIFTGLAAGSYIITSTDANGCTATTTAVITQPTGTAPNLALGSDITNSLFATTGVTQTIVYNIAEIAGNPAVGDTLRINTVPGFNINFNTSIFSTVVGTTTYTLDNARWKIDNSNPAFVSIILKAAGNAAGPGTLLCNERVNVAVTITRNTTDISTFTLSARLRRANGELILNNNLNSIVLTAD